MKYSLSVPFMQRLFQLAQEGFLNPGHGGFVGQITANSFMKREFGKKLIEEYFAGRDGNSGIDLTHVIDAQRRLHTRARHAHRNPLRTQS